MTAGDDEALPLGGTWTRTETVTDELVVVNEVAVEQDDPGRIFHVSDVLLERLLTEAGYTRTDPAPDNSPDTTQETP